MRKPRVAILSTGDEVVPFSATPGAFQIRNSKAVSLAAQVRLAGGEPVMLGNAGIAWRSCGRRLAAGCARIFWCCPAACRWGSTIWWKAC